MARNFIGAGQVPYVGTKYILPVQQIAPGAQVIPLTFQWLVYQSTAPNTANINVLVDLQSVGNQQSLSKIAAVYIDNLGVDVPVYCFFPDTGHTVVAPPNTAGWYLVFTNGKLLWVCAQGLIPGDLSKTTVIVANFYMPPSSDTELPQTVQLWKASPAITRGTTIYNTQFGVPALGDQAKQYILNMTAPVMPPARRLPIFDTPKPSGIITLTGISLYVSYAATSNVSPDLEINSTGLSGTLYQFRYFTGDSSQVTYLQLYSRSGLQIPLVATESWFFDNVLSTGLATGLAELFLEWTYQP